MLVGRVLSSWHARRKDGSFAFLFRGEVGFLLPKTLSKTKKPSHRNTRLRLESPLVRRVEARFETRGAKSTDSKRPAISRSSPRGGASAASPSVACAPRATTLLAARARPPLSSPSSTMAIDFELSGLGPSAAEDISLEDIREAAVECGFTKPGVPASKPNAQRANLTTFFKTLGVTSLSGFKKRFHAEKLPCPYPDMTPLIMEKVRFSRSRGAPRRGRARRRARRRRRRGACLLLLVVVATSSSSAAAAAARASETLGDAMTPCMVDGATREGMTRRRVVNRRRLASCDFLSENRDLPVVGVFRRETSIVSPFAHTKVQKYCTRIAYTYRPRRRI